MMVDEFEAAVTVEDTANAKEGTGTPEGGDELGTLSALPALTVGDLLGLDIPPTEYFAGDTWAADSISLVYAPRGIGKTWFTLSLAVGFATGRTLCDWTAHKRVPVLVVDGEMQPRLLQTRLARLLVGSGAVTLEPREVMDLDDSKAWLNTQAEAPAAAVRAVGLQAVEKGIQLYNLSSSLGHKMFGNGVPDLDTVEGRLWVEYHIEATGARVVIFDNISCLCRSADENTAKEWGPFGDWLIRLRATGLLVIAVHHTGKDGNQRGTSKREDPLDTSLELTRPGGYEEGDGCKLAARFTKTRSVSGLSAATRRLSLDRKGAGGLWFSHSLEAQNAKARALELKKEGSSIRDITKIMKEEGFQISKSSVQRYLREGV